MKIETRPTEMSTKSDTDGSTTENYNTFLFISDQNIEKEYENFHNNNKFTPISAGIIILLITTVQTIYGFLSFYPYYNNTITNSKNSITHCNSCDNSCDNICESYDNSYKKYGNDYSNCFNDRSNSAYNSSTLTMFEVLFVIISSCTIIGLLSLHKKIKRHYSNAATVSDLGKPTRSKTTIVTIIELLCENSYCSSLSITTLDNLFILGTSIYMALRLLLRSYVGQCSNNADFIELLRCNPYHDSGGIPIDTLFGLVLVPLLSTSILRSASWSYHIISWIICTISLVIVTFLLVKNSNLLLLTVLLAYLPCSMIMLFETRRQNLGCFQMHQKMKELLIEKEELINTIQKDDVRTMIGNVAHDLKTVSYYNHYKLFVSFSYELLLSLLAISSICQWIRSSITRVARFNNNCY